MVFYNRNIRSRTKHYIYFEDGCEKGILAIFLICHFRVVNFLKNWFWTLTFPVKIEGNLIFLLWNEFLVHGLKILILMQPSMGTLNSSSSRVVKVSTPSWRLILRYINFGMGESSPILFFDMMNLHLIIFEAWWILNKRAFYCFIIFFILKWILT